MEEKYKKILEQQLQLLSERSQTLFIATDLQVLTEMPYTKNGHSGYQRKWNDSVITILVNLPPTDNVTA